MQTQHQITEPGPLLDEKGCLREAGWAKRLILDYSRSAIRAGGLRIKEWDYYLIGNEHYAVALTIADNSYMGLDSISLLDFDNRWEQTTSPMRVLPLGHTGLPATSERGHVASNGKGYAMLFQNDGSGARRLTAHMDKFKDGKPIDIDLTLTDPPQETIVIATPFAGAPKAFYYNQKINCLRAAGSVEFDGKTYAFDPADSFGVLDWGRGVWTYKNTWYWSSASGQVGGVPFGFNLGYGFGNTTAASENMLFFGGKAHKLGRVTFEIPMKNGKEDYLRPWNFTSDDSRFEMEFQPILDRASKTSVGVIASDQHQVFGKFTGTAVLDDGTELKIRNFMGFAEKVMNKW